MKPDDFKRNGTTVPNDVFIDRKEGQVAPDSNQPHQEVEPTLEVRMDPTQGRKASANKGKELIKAEHARGSSQC